MKSILISIKPEWICKILNGEKTIEVRKTAPKCELPVDVYIYCTKGDNLHRNKVGWWFVHDHPTTFITQDDSATIREQKPFNGKVVAKFALRKVEDVLRVEGPCPCDALRSDHRTMTLIPTEFYDMSCLSQSEVTGYGNGRKVYAWHISDLEIFDRPRGLCEFHTNVKKEPPEELSCPECGEPMEYYEYKYLTKAPRSWQFIEVE